MKIIASVSLIALLGAGFGAIPRASAATTNIYIGDWGTTNGGTSVNGNGNIGTVGWTGVQGGVPSSGPPYLGIYQATGASDIGSGAALPANTVYFTTLTSPNQATPGMFYTTDTSGTGAGGDMAFADIDPTHYTNLTLAVEIRSGGGQAYTNYFAVRVGGAWYVATNNPMPYYTGGYPTFTNATLLYTNLASVWNTLTVNATNVVIGPTAAGNLSGPITGVGIVELPTSGGANYNRFTVSAFVPGGGPPPTPPTITAPAISQTTYEGGGASFLILASGTQPLTYIWQTNGVTLTEGGKYSGTTNNQLTILNCDDADAAAAYSVFVTNAGGISQTNSGFTLTVNPVPDGTLYAESFPYVGPNGNIPLTGVGWLGAFQGNTALYQSGPGIGNVFSYSGVATTNIYYATTNSDTGASGLPFVAINPDNYPAVTIQAMFTPGNGAALNPSNVVAYWAVQMDDGNWYSTVKQIPVETAQLNDYQLYQLAFSRAATNWNTVTIGAGSASIGPPASGPLTGSIIGAGVVITHLGLNGGGDFNFNNFAITTNAVTVLPPVIGSAGTPYSQIVASGGGASFGVSATGQAPFTYGWTMNGVRLVNGGRVSGATNSTVTIANLTMADSGATIIAFVTNSVGVDESDNYFPTTLTVTNPAVGVLYSESFPFTGPLPGNYPISSVGWVEAAPNVPNALFETIGGDGAVFAYNGGASTTAYYTSTASDTNQAGLPFPNIIPSDYPDLTFSVDIAPTFNSTNVTAYFAVQLAGANWFVAANPIPVPPGDSGTYSTYTMSYNPAAANWKALTITGSGALIGATPSGNLSGTLTGAGLVFVTANAGGNNNFDNFTITGTGLGGITVGPASAGSLPLSWVGNPAVSLQSSTNVGHGWQDVPGSAGQYSRPIPLTGPQQFFRLVQH